MAKKGEIARATVQKKIAEAFGEDFIGLIDKNLYVWVTDGGADKVQMKITLTMPKVQVAADAAQGVPEPEMSGGAWETAIPKQEKNPYAPTAEDQKKIDELMYKLGLNDK